MTWNYRVIKRTNSDPEAEYLQIHEVYYDDEGQIEGWTKAVAPGGVDPQELRRDLAAMERALEKPFLVIQVSPDGKEYTIELEGHGGAETEELDD